MVALLVHIIYTLSLSNFSHVTDAVLKDSLDPADYILHTSANTKKGELMWSTIEEEGGMLIDYLHHSSPPLDFLTLSLPRSFPCPPN